MTPKQIDLVKKCIQALRHNQIDPYTSELVEVGQINGVNPKTARTLVQAGVLVYDMPRNATEYTNDHVRFPTLDELKDTH